VDEVWNDFNGDMPAKLGLEPLQARDAAWRAATAEVPAEPIAGTPSKRLQGKTPILPPTTADSTTLIGPDTQPRRRAPLFFAGALGVGVFAAAAAFLMLRKPEPPPPSSRFVVVEKQAREDVPEAPPGAPSVAEPAAPATPPVASSGGAQVAPAPSTDPVSSRAGESKPRAGGDAASLSRAVQKQRGRIESCFLSHVKEVDGRPEVAVRFRVNPSGKVDAAELSPAALSSTPLGQCVLGVARGIDFGPQAGPLNFSIPITARRLK
jgi:hypothetical protein